AEHRGRGDVHGDTAEVVVEWHVDERALGRERGVVDEEADVETVRRSRQHVADVAATEIGDDGARLDAVRVAQPDGRLVEQRLAAGDEDHVAPAPGALVGERGTEAFRRARDQCPRPVLLRELHGRGRYRAWVRGIVAHYSEIHSHYEAWRVCGRCR